MTYAALKQHYGNQHPNAKWPNTFESRLFDERNLQAYKANLHPTRTSHTRLIIGVVLIVIVVGAAWAYLPGVFQSSTGTNPACASFPFPPNGNQALAEHYHALLYIYVNGQQVNLPANIGDGDTAGLRIQSNG